MRDTQDGILRNVSTSATAKQLLQLASGKILKLTPARTLLSNWKLLINLEYKDFFQLWWREKKGVSAFHNSLGQSAAIYIYSFNIANISNTSGS